MRAGSVEARITALSEFQHDESLAAVIHQLLQETASRRSPPTFAQQHPNGFDKILISESGEFKLIAHFWKAEHRDNDVHDHRWHFTSSVLQGGLVADEFVPSDNGTIMDRFRYSSPSGGSHFTLTADGQEKIAPAATSLLEAPCVYFQDRSALHRARTSSSTVTLLVQESVRVEQTTVYRDTSAYRISPGGQSRVAVQSVPAERLSCHLENLGRLLHR